ncbi:coiled-coil domain-containing protein 115 [Telopea speciosissima]|uniref:coiled-coil domain-containing protein 115 n=1 Tax=Telopea speciosissima TaxID=54955 RepID=UPI001CC47752|nr:coiled-coil domain-containing protein 115 [Telopea speciosissima]XP_043714390.1 coiled-coil domain-containing protein 115 [Telopea speciosissima]
MEEQEVNQSCENGRKNGEEGQEEDSVLQFMDSIDSYLCLMDSLSSALRQGWLELASARHSMGTSRVSSALFDLKQHSAATTTQVIPYGFECSAPEDPMVRQPHFTLSKWSSFNARKCSFGEVAADEEEFQKKLQNPQLRHRSPSQLPESQETHTVSKGSPLSADDEAKKERSKSLSVFGSLVSPKLRASQHSFETALEIVVEIANRRSLMLSAFAQVRQEMECNLE